MTTKADRQIAKARSVVINGYRPLPMQKAFHESKKRQRLYGGAMGGGKSRALCEDAVLNCCYYPGNRGFIGRRQNSHFDSSTYKVLTINSTMKDLLDNKLVVENKSKRFFRFWNGSELFYGGIEGSDGADSEKMFSTEFGFILIDEAFEITERQFAKIDTRLRHSLPDKLPDGVERRYDRKEEKKDTLDLGCFAYCSGDGNLKNNDDFRTEVAGRFNIKLGTDYGDKAVKQIIDAVILGKKQITVITDIKYYPHYHIGLASNPAQNWLKQKFIVNRDSNPDTDFFPALPKDNIYNPSDYVDKMRETFKDDEQALKAYIEGSWDAIGDIDDLISRDVLNFALDAPVQGTGKKVTIVCDPARFGDDQTVIHVWRDHEQEKIERFSKKDTMEIVGWLRQMGKETGCADIDYIVDVNGLGAGVVDRLGETGETVLGINFAEQALYPDLYYNRRTEIFFVTRNAIRDGQYRILNDEPQLSQMASIKYRYTSGQKLRIEAKSEIKKRIGRSPDDADCLSMGIWAMQNRDSLAEKFLNERTVYIESERPEHWDKAAGDDTGDYGFCE